jgi:hypothetical protein
MKVQNNMNLVENRSLTQQYVFLERHGHTEQCGFSQEQYQPNFVLRNNVSLQKGKINFIRIRHARVLAVVDMGWELMRPVSLL